MKIARAVAVWLGVAIMALCLSCAKNFVITDEMRRSLKPNSSCNIGAVIDALPDDFPESSKPSAEAIQAFKGHLSVTLFSQKIFSNVRFQSPPADYEVVCRILEFPKGSSLSRFVFGSIVGSTSLLVSISLIHTEDSAVVFGGNFKSNGGSGLASADDMFRQVAVEFARALEEQVKQLSSRE